MGIPDEEGLAGGIRAQGGVVTLIIGGSNCLSSGCPWMLSPAKLEARFVIQQPLHVAYRKDIVCYSLTLFAKELENETF